MAAITAPEPLKERSDQSFSASHMDWPKSGLPVAPPGLFPPWFRSGRPGVRFYYRDFYSQILNMNRSSLRTRSFRRIHFSVFRCRFAEDGFTGLKRFPGLSRNGPQVLIFFPRERAQVPIGIALASAYSYSTS